MIGIFWNSLPVVIISLFLLSACDTESKDPYSNHSVLLETKSWKTNQEKHKPFVYIDLRSQELYNKGHLPGAINLTRSDIRKKDSEFVGMAVDADSLAILLGHKGISSDDWIILYDEKGGVESARLWWLLRVYGHEKVKILNGDIHLFNQEMEVGSHSQDSTVFNFAGRTISDWSVNYNEFERMRANPSTKILDCRSTAEYNGEYIKPGAYSAGHIDGAFNICYSNTIEDIGDGNLKMKSPEVLRKIYANFSQEDTILVYCQSGVRSAHTLMVLREILNYKHVYNFDGSWIEWSYRNQFISRDSLLQNDGVI